MLNQMTGVVQAVTPQPMGAPTVQAEGPGIPVFYSFTLYSNDDYRICRYEYIEPPSEAGAKTFVAKGNNLPEIKGLRIVLFGQWEMKGKEKALSVTHHDIPLPMDKAGIVRYLSSLKCGFGAARARELVERSKGNFWWMLEHSPDELSSGSISMDMINGLKAKIHETDTQRNVFEMMSGTPITVSKVKKLCKKFGANALDILQKHPYQLCDVEGFPFQMVDAMALTRCGVDPSSVERRMAAAVCALNSAAKEGHVCLPRAELVDKMVRLLTSNRPRSVTKELCDAAISHAAAQHMVACTSGYVYTMARYQQERRIVAEMFRIMNAGHNEVQEARIDELISNYESANKLTMADSQKDAVRASMENQVCVLTGGPGTGKTTTTKAILYCHKELFGEDAAPVLLSPTGKAARRMSESTNYPASTIHSGLNLIPDGDEEPESEDHYNIQQPEYLPGNLFLIDESSMADQHITCELVRRIPSGAKLVFVGDPDQLPSVGCGNVLYELIRSQAVPVVKLSVIFRQAKDNPIVENAARIMNHQTDLLYNESFVKMDLQDPEAIFNKSVSMYVQAVRKYGMESTVLLCPYRKATALNVNRFNLAIQEILNPAKPGAPFMKGKSVFVSSSKSVPVEFREGDKVMMTANRKVARNGDTGFVRQVAQVLDKDHGVYKTVLRVEFNGSGEISEMDADAVRDLDLAYCNTVHKSQGEEYKIVIMVMSSLHTKMLRRNLFYTAITRAKEDVLLIGERSAIVSAILNDDDAKRYTLLGDRLHAEAVKEEEKARAAQADDPTAQSSPCG